MKPQDLADITRKRMKALDLSPHALAKRLEGRVNRATLYRYLNGENDSIRSDSLALVWAELGLIVTEKEAK